MHFAILGYLPYSLLSDSLRCASEFVVLGSCGDMRILIYSINFSPELTSTGKYTGEMSAWLAARGHDVRVVTAPPYYPAWKVSAGYSIWRYRTEGRIFRCPLWVPRKPSGFKRIVHLASFAISSLPVMLLHALWRPDVVWVVEPTFFGAPTAWLVARLSGGRAWLHIQDFEVDAAFKLGLLRSPLLRNFIVHFERWWMARFDRVSTISENMLARLKCKGVASERTVFFPNWVDTESIFPSNGENRLRKELGLGPEILVALYSGNMGDKQGLEVIVAAAQILRHQPHILFVMCGNGAARTGLEKLADGLTNIRWLPLQPTERLNDLLNAANIHLLPQRVNAEDLVMPSKLTGMLASGRPVVATANAGTAIAEVVIGRGLVVSPEDPVVFAQAILSLAGDSDLRNKLGAAAREYAVNNLHNEVILRRFEKELFALAYDTQ